MKKNILKITYAGLLIALAVVTGFIPFEKNILGLPYLRLNLSYIPIMLSSILLGPIYGGIVGAGADIMKYFVTPSSGGITFYPGITLSYALVGILPSLIIFNARKKTLLLYIAVFVTTISTCILTTIWLPLIFKIPFEVMIWPRLGLALFMFPIYAFIIDKLKKVLEKTTKTNYF